MNGRRRCECEEAVHGFGTVLAASWPILENPEGPSASRCRVVCVARARGGDGRFAALLPTLGYEAQSVPAAKLGLGGPSPNTSPPGLPRRLARRYVPCHVHYMGIMHPRFIQQLLALGVRGTADGRTSLLPALPRTPNGLIFCVFLFYFIFLTPERH